MLAEWNFKPPQGAPVPDGFAYASDTNDQWLDVDGIRSLLDQLGI